MGRSTGVASPALVVPGRPLRTPEWIGSGVSSLVASPKGLHASSEFIGDDKNPARVRKGTRVMIVPIEKC